MLEEQIALDDRGLLHQSRISEDMSSPSPLQALGADRFGDEASGGSAPGTVIPILSQGEIFARLKAQCEDARFKSFRCMYSSVFGGITTDVACMVLPLDDHMVHRGHSVFDTCIILNGYMYELDAHLDRFLRSAAKAKITPPFDRSTIRGILEQTAAAGKCESGILRYWMSAGRGNFDLSTKDCMAASLYASLVDENVLENADLDGVKVITSSVPIKDEFFATVKSTNYLANALVVKEAEEKGASVGIWLDRDGNIAEGQNMNIGFVMEDGELVVPTFDNILSGCTVRRVLQLVREGAVQGLQVAQVRRIPEAEARKAKEMVCIMSGWLILPVVEWDGKPVGTGKPGPVSQSLLQCMQQDMLSGPTTVRTPLPLVSE